jgi:hypothetical protein
MVSPGQPIDVNRADSRRCPGDQRCVGRWHDDLESPLLGATVMIALDDDRYYNVKASR